MKSFFTNTPLQEVAAALTRVRAKTDALNNFTLNALRNFDLIIGQSNRPDRMHTQLVEWNIIPKFDYFFSGSSTGIKFISKNWVERELLDGDNVQNPYIWDSPHMWKEFFRLIEDYEDKEIAVISSAPRKEHAELRNYSNVNFLSPTPELAVQFEYDKRFMLELYKSIDIPYHVCNYDSAENVNHGYKFHAKHFNSEILAVQATQGSGGVTAKSSIQALFFVNNEESFDTAMRLLSGEGPVRVMKKYSGIPSNSGGLTLPFGTYISGIPTVKPCGVEELGTKPGTSGGNQWDTRFPEYAVNSQFEQIVKVGSKMASNGYFGIFGLDPIMPVGPEDIVFNSEINARSQGPDPQRAFAARQIGIPTLETMQLAFYLNCPTNLFPAPEDYNLVTRWLKIPPYLKLFAKKDQTVSKNFNGYWRWDKGLAKAEPENALFRIVGAPSIGQKILVNSPDNFLYVKFLDPEVEIYTQDEKPRLTSLALEIVNYLYSSL